MKKTPAIPSVSDIPEPVAKLLGPIKENIEFMTGQRAAKLARLGPTSTLSDVINKVNDLIDRLQGEK